MVTFGQGGSSPTASTGRKLSNEPCDRLGLFDRRKVSRRGHDPERRSRNALADPPRSVDRRDGVVLPDDHERPSADLVELVAAVGPIAQGVKGSDQPVGGLTRGDLERSGQATSSACADKARNEIADKGRNAEATKPFLRHFASSARLRRIGLRARVDQDERGHPRGVTQRERQRDVAAHRTAHNEGGAVRSNAQRDPIGHLVDRGGHAPGRVRRDEVRRGDLMPIEVRSQRIPKRPVEREGVKKNDREPQAPIISVRRRLPERPLVERPVAPRTGRVTTSIQEERDLVVHVGVGLADRVEFRFEGELYVERLVAAV
jgi:hypothetical protein